MTGADDGGDRLVLHFPWVKPEYGRETGGPLVSPTGWPPRISPAPGEPLEALRQRVVVGDPFLQAVMSRMPRVPLPVLDGRHPAELTMQWWLEEWPEAPPKSWRDKPAEEYYLGRVYWRLEVALFGQLRARHFVARSPHPDDPYLLVDMEPEQWANIYMAVRFAHDGWRLGPEPWRGSEPPPGLRTYPRLMLWPVQAKTTPGTLANPPKKSPIPPTRLRAWWKDYVAQHINDDRHPTAKEQLAAAKAAFPENAPPTKRAMQGLRADLDLTPPEWGKAGWT